MNDDDKPLTKKDLMELLRELEGIKERIHETEIRILKSFAAFSAANELRLANLENFAATAGKRLAYLEADRAERLFRPAQIEKKLDRRQ